MGGWGACGPGWGARVGHGTRGAGWESGGLAAGESGGLADGLPGWMPGSRGGQPAHGRPGRSKHAGTDLAGH